MNNKIIGIVLLIICIPLSVFAQEKRDARKLYFDKKYDESIEVCFEELKENPSNSNSYIVLGWGLIQKGRYQETVDYMTQGLRYNSSNIWIIKNLAESYYYLGSYDQSLARFEQFVKSEASSNSKAECYYYIGEIYIAKKEFVNADTALTLACYYINKNWFWWTRLGFAREEQKAYQAALDAYSRAIQIDPNREEPQRGRDRVRVNIAQ
ncbi:MAG: tetratricopeptide repeat protein [Spirochaetales bacterium]|nr:tetratricopeptide repeat protein [Spirochaetales bacterium]